MRKKSYGCRAENLWTSLKIECARLWVDIFCRLCSVAEKGAKIEKNQQKIQDFADEF